MKDTVRAPMEPLSDDELPEPANLRFLRRLVTILTVVMIGGMVVVVGLLIVRAQQPGPLPVPDAIALPDGVAPQAVTYGADVYMVLSEDNRLFVFDRVTGALRATVPID